jgi:DNA replication licensing factor MCM2
MSSSGNRVRVSKKKKENFANYEEASEVNILEEDEERIEEEEKIQGDDLDELEEDDYHHISKLDEYDIQHLDEDEYSEMSLGQRRKAEEEIKKREMNEIRAKKYAKMGRNVPEMLKEESILDEDSNEMFDYELKKRKENYYEVYDNLYANDEEKEGDKDEEKYLELDNIRGKLSEWIKSSKTVNFIKKSFERFLLNFKDTKGNAIYEEKINQMVSRNEKSLEILYRDLSDRNPTLAYWIFETPKLIIPYLNDTVYNIACNFYPGYQNIQDSVYIQIKDFPLEEKIRDLRTFHINTLIKVKGVITKRYPVYQMLKKSFHICMRCGDRRGPIFHNEKTEFNFGQCPNCHSPGPYQLEASSQVYGNHQKVIIQESPSIVEPGRVPRSKEVFLLDNNIDSARPGEEVEIIGIFTSLFDMRMNVTHGFPIFSTFIECNSVQKLHEMHSTHISETDKERIRALSKNPDIFSIMAQSVAPSIYGHEEIKQSIILALFGGVPSSSDGHKIRGDINVLLLGDPGLGKSQFLKYIQNVSPRCVYTTGKGASAVGLTATVKRDQNGEWCLEGGALVLADTGICLIDEFDKMNESDRTSIHEAMEQQCISISKAGIIANLHARCSVIAAANPVKGVYDDKLSFQDNVELSDPILSRFDVLCVLKDDVDIIQDKKLADFIINSHIKNHPDNGIEEEDDEQEKNEEEREFNNLKDGIDQDLLKKYIIYAKTNFKPEMTKLCGEKLQNFYVQLRQESKKTSGLKIMVRHFESLIRLATASAKLHLRKNIAEKDCDIAISVLLSSFIKSQKPSIAEVLKKKFAIYLKRSISTNSKLSYILNNLINQHITYCKIRKDEGDLNEQNIIKLPFQEFVSLASENHIHDLTYFLKSDYFKNNFILESENSVEYIKKII